MFLFLTFTLASRHGERCDCEWKHWEPGLLTRLTPASVPPRSAWLSFFFLRDKVLLEYHLLIFLL